MRMATVISAVFFATCALTLTVWLGRSNVGPAQEQQAGNGKPAVDPGVIEVSATGPYPKLVIDQPTYDFEQMIVDQTMSHTFEIRNEGAAPLKLGKLETSCTCSAGELNDHKVSPGGTATATLSWTPKEVESPFTASATIKTNDPEQRKLSLEVTGNVERTVYLLPGGRWDMGDLPEDEPAHVGGVLLSSFLDTFQIVDAKTSSGLLQAEFTRLEDTELKEHKAKSGYQVDVTLMPGIPIGTFRGSVTIQTDAAEHGDFEIRVRGRRHGPIRFVPSSGLKWYAAELAAGLGRFPAAQGGVGSVWLFVNGLDDEFRFESVASELDWLETDLSKDPQSDQRYKLTFRVPPNRPPTSRTQTNPVTVNVTTNHPDVPEIEFTVMFVSTK